MSCRSPFYLALGIVVCVAYGCDRRSDGSQSNRGGDQNAALLPSFATVIVDFSASFAPLSQTDRLALLETSRALADLTSQDWPPPTTIVWRKIGTNSTTPSPLCDVLEYKRSLVGALNTVEDLRAKLKSCAESVVLASRAHGMQEAFTDISDGIMMAVQNWQPVSGKKTLIILSDFLEEHPKGFRPASLELHGESVLLLHRPGTTEDADIEHYLSRIRTWTERLRQAGAESVAALPAFRTTSNLIQRALSKEGSNGTSVAVLSDLTYQSGADVVPRAIRIIAATIARESGTWDAPVSAGWFTAGAPASHTTAVAPVVFVPRIARHADELNTTESFRVALEEMGTALARQRTAGRGDLDGALRLITNGDQSAHRYVFVLSDFLQPPPTSSGDPLRGYRVVLVYRAGTSRGGAEFFDRLQAWRAYSSNAGATKVCALDMATMTESAINACLH
jgi:hypothetical protein